MVTIIWLLVFSLLLEYFGAEPVLSGDEYVKEEEEEKGEGPDSAEPDPSDLSPKYDIILTTPTFLLMEY